MMARPALIPCSRPELLDWNTKVHTPEQMVSEETITWAGETEKKKGPIISRGGGGCSRFDSKVPTSSRCLLRRNDIERIFGAKLGHLCNTAQREREAPLLRGIRSTRTRKHNKNNTKGCYTPKTHDVTWGSVRAYPCIVPPPALTPQHSSPGALAQWGPVRGNPRRSLPALPETAAVVRRLFFFFFGCLLWRWCLHRSPIE